MQSHKKPAMILAASTIAFATMFAPVAMAVENTPQQQTPTVTVTTPAQSEDAAKPTVIDANKLEKTTGWFASDKDHPIPMPDENGVPGGLVNLTPGEYTISYKVTDAKQAGEGNLTIWRGTTTDDKGVIQNDSTKDEHEYVKDGQSVKVTINAGDVVVIPASELLGQFTLTPGIVTNENVTYDFDLNKGVTMPDGTFGAMGIIAANDENGVPKPVNPNDSNKPHTSAWQYEGVKPGKYKVTYTSTKNTQYPTVHGTVYKPGTTTDGVYANGAQTGQFAVAADWYAPSDGGTPVTKEATLDLPEGYLLELPGNIPGKAGVLHFERIGDADQPEDPNAGAFNEAEQNALKELKAEVAGADGKTTPLNGWDIAKTTYELGDIADIHFTTNDTFNAQLDGTLKWVDAAGNELTPYGENGEAQKVVKAVYTVVGKTTGHKTEYAFTLKVSVPEALKDVTVTIDGKDHKLGDAITLNAKPDQIKLAGLPDGYTVANATRTLVQPQQDASKFTQEQQDAFKNMVVTIDGTAVSKAGDSVVTWPKEPTADMQIGYGFNANDLGLNAESAFLDKDGNVLDPAKSDDLAKAVAYTVTFTQKDAKTDSTDKPTTGAGDKTDAKATEDKPSYELAVLFGDQLPDTVDTAWLLNQDQLTDTGAVATILDKDGKTAFTQNIAWPANSTDTPSDPNKPGSNEQPTVDQYAALKDMKIVADGKAVSFDYKGGDIKLDGQPTNVQFANVPDGWTVSDASKTNDYLTTFKVGDTATQVTAVTVAKDNALDVRADAKGNTPNAGTVFVTYRVTNTGDKTFIPAAPDVAQGPLGLQQVTQFNEGVAPKNFSGNLPQIQPGQTGEFTLAYALYDATSDIAFGQDASLPLVNAEAVKGLWTVNENAIKDTGFTVTVSNGDVKADYKFTWDAAEKKAETQQKLAQTGVAAGLVAMLGIGGLGVSGGLHALSKRFRRDGE